MLNTIREYVELCNKLGLRVIELLSDYDEPGKAAQEIESIRAIKEVERPKVMYELYKKDEATKKFDMVEEIGGFYLEGELLFNTIKDMTDTKFDIVIELDSEGAGTHTQEYKVNGEWYTITISPKRNIQSVFEEWGRNMKTDLKIISNTGVEHEVKYNKDFETATFY